METKDLNLIVTVGGGGGRSGSSVALGRGGAGDSPKPAPKALTVGAVYVTTAPVAISAHRAAGMGVLADGLQLAGVELRIIDRTGRLSEAQLQETAEEIAWRINAHA